MKTNVIIFSFLVIILLSSCNANDSRNQYVVKETTSDVSQYKDAITIYNEHRDSLLNFGVGQSENYSIKFGNNGTKFNWVSTVSIEDAFIKTKLTGYFYNSNTKQHEQIGNTETFIIIFKDREEMKNVVLKSLELINNGYSKKVPTDDWIDFPLFNEYELRIEKGEGVISYTLFKFASNKKYKTESAWVTKTQLQGLKNKL